MKKLTILKTTISILVLQFGFFSFAKDMSTTCSEEKLKQLQLLETNAIQEIDSWMSLLQTKYKIDLTDVLMLNSGQTTDSYGNNIVATLSYPQHAANIALCAQDVLKSGLKYICDPEATREFGARTFPILFKTVTLNDKYFWSTSHKRQIGVLIHEASHKCSTTDAAQFKDTSPRNVGVIPWYWIGDTYEYWAVEGLCLPGVDCP